MSRMIPTIYVDGNSYEIKRNRYILCEIDKFRQKSVLTEDEQKSITILQDKYARLEKLARRLKELEDCYYTDFDDEIGAKYEKAKALYNELYADVADYEVKAQPALAKSQKAALDRMEQLVIFALTINSTNGETIRTRTEAEDIWCHFVDEIGRENAAEWLTYAFAYLSGQDEENTDAFFVAAREKSKQAMNLRRGIETAK